MGSEEEVLTGLERFLTEFFHPSTTNQRKHEIEEQLNRFGNQNGAWKHCIHIFTRTRNEYVLMYCLQVLENIVNKMWIGFDPTSKAEIRKNLNHLLLLQHKEIPIFISHKLIKVIVDIARVDWPMFYPNFFSSLLQLATSSVPQYHGDTRSLGLAALRIASEELAAPREDISGRRKEELKKLLLLEVPNMLHVITESLRNEWENCFKQFSQMSFSTPPPSPDDNDNDLFGLFSSVNENIFLKASTTLKVPTESNAIMVQSLECLCHLFSWIPLSTNISSDLLSVIFQYARLGCCINESSAMLSNLGSHAMTCINELMMKNCVPHNFEDYLVRVFKQTFHTLQQLTNNDNPRSLLERLDENYLEKFIEFLRLFVSMHFSRIEANSSFPLVPFLTLLFKFTFNQSSHEYYMNCLDVWEVFVDFVATKLEQSKGHTTHILDRYRDGMVVFASSVFQHIQFRYNKAHLDELNNTNYDDNGHTEWQSYVIENLEIIAKICNLYPTEMMNVIYPVLDETASVYLKTKWDMLTLSSGVDDCNRLHCTLKDLTISLQAFGRISELFIADHFHERFESSMDLINKFLNIALFGSQLQLYKMEGRFPTLLLEDLIEVHAEVLAVLQPYTHWLSQLYSEAQQHGGSQSQLSQMLNSYIDVIVPVFNNRAPDKIVLSAAHTLLSVVTTVRATFLSQSAVIEKLFNDVSNGSCNKLKTQSQHLIYKSLSNLLILPWPNTPDQEQKWDARQKGHRDFTKSLIGDFLSLSNNIIHMERDRSLRERAKPVIHRTVLIVVELVEAISDEILKTRQLCYNSIYECITISLDLFPLYLDQPDTSEVFFSLFLTIFRSLRRQMGAEMIAKTIQTFINKFSPEQLQNTILHENVAGVRVVEKLLKILEMVIDEPGGSFKSFTPSVIVFAIEQIYPIVSQRASPDVKGALFDLLHHLLLRRHRYFFPSPVIASMLMDEVAARSRSGTIAHKPQFLAIMSAFGNLFMQPDIAIFKQALDTLEVLNAKLKLYEKLQHILASDGVLFQFVNVLIQVLINKSHNLLQDDICVVVYNMATTDGNFFHGTFIQEFLRNTEGITPDQKKSLYQSFKPELDLPSFTLNLLRFVNDLRYYRLCNSSLPEGTVHF